MGAPPAADLSPKQRRFVFAIGDVGIAGVPHSLVPNTSNHASGGVGKHLAALMDASSSGSAATGTGSSSPSYGIELLRIASTGASTATLGAHPAFQHVPLLDDFVRLRGHSNSSVNIVKAASGQYHSLLLLSLGQILLTSPDPSENGTAVALGTNAAGDEAATGVQDIAAGRSHFVVCTDSGSVYTFGWSNEYGQLGDGTMWRVDPPTTGVQSLPLLTDPKRIPGFGPTSVAAAADGAAGSGVPPTPLIIAVAAGDNHTVLLAASKTAVYACGRGHCGQLGTCRRVELSTTFHVMQKMFGSWTSAIAAAADHTILLLDTGKLVAFGDNTTGAACTGTSKNAFEPQQASWAADSLVNETTSAPPQTVEPNTNPSGSMTAKKRAADAKAMESIKAPYGSVESFLYPRRIYRFPADVAAGAKVVDAVVTSPTLTIATTVDQELFSAGLRVPVDPVKQRADGRGHLGRHTANTSDARQFGQVSLRRCSTAAEGGWKAICGRGFSAYWDSAAGIVRVHGTIGGNSPSISSLDPRHVVTYQSPLDDSILLDVGRCGGQSQRPRRVVSAVAVQRGLLLVVEES